MYWVHVCRRLLRESHTFKVEKVRGIQDSVSHAGYVIGEEDKVECLSLLSRRGDARNLAKRKPRYTL